MSELILSVDPGSKNLAFVFAEVENKSRLNFYFKSETDLPELIRLFMENKLSQSNSPFPALTPTRILIEKVGPSPQMGVTSAFNFGYGVACTNLLLRHLYPTTQIQFVAPTSWKYGVGLIKKPKKASVTKVKSLISQKKLTPKSSFYSNQDLTKGFSHHIGDCILMAYFIGVVLGDE